MNYFQAMLLAFTGSWFDYIKQDSISGNGFQIFAYGLKLIGKYVLYFILRLIIVALFPISAILFMVAHRMNAKYDEERRAQADLDL